MWDDLLDEVYCAGNEEKCKHNGIGVHDCIPREAVSIRCYNGKIIHNGIPGTLLGIVL